MQYVTCDKHCVWFAVCVQVVRMVCKAAGMQFTDTELHTSILCNCYTEARYSTPRDDNTPMIDYDPSNRYLFLQLFL